MSYLRPDFPGQDAGIINDDWVITNMKRVLKDWAQVLEKFTELTKFVNDYFSNLDIDDEISNKIDDMASSGDLSNVIGDALSNETVPKFVADIQSMRDTKNIYVLTTNAHIYYYNGSSFIDSGLVYGIFSKAVTPSVIILDTNHETLGISKLTDINGNKIYVISDTITKDMISGLPWYGYNYTLATLKADTTGTGSTIYLACRMVGKECETKIAFSPSDQILTSWTTISPSIEIGGDVNKGNHAQLNINSIFDFEPNKMYRLSSDIAKEDISQLPWYGYYSTLICLKPITISSTATTVYIMVSGGPVGVFFSVAYSNSNNQLTPWHGTTRDYVTVGPGGDFNTIQTAVNFVNDGGTVHVRNGIYNEQINAVNKTVHIVGETRNGVILRDTSGNYATPPLEIGSGSVENLTIEVESTGAGDNLEYCIHADFDQLENNELLLNGLTLKNNTHACVGMGTRPNSKITIRDCELYQTDEKHASVKRGALYIHNTDAGGNSELILINNTINEKGHRVGMTLQTAESTVIDATIVGNSISANGLTSNSIISDGTSAGVFSYNEKIQKNANTFGNNIDSLN